MNAEAVGINPALQAAQVKTFSIDSREVKAGDVFFALSQPEYKNNCFNGDFEDSTKYVASAFEKGAIAAVVRRDRFEEHKAELEKYQRQTSFRQRRDSRFAKTCTRRLSRMEQTRRRRYRKRGKNDGEGIDGARFGKFGQKGFKEY